MNTRESIAPRAVTELRERPLTWEDNNAELPWVQRQQNSIDQISPEMRRQRKLDFHHLKDN